ncbi:uncharacterized protein LOC126143485 isoform X2 [Schistocerca cancellata]|uniref:uncharacterized protein LOC126143485 isoform X2 n=1 Tax=Schistocerca cancellata TaxID=274614 RepID=UPI0021179B70|nr:uncharacterized protein LOC126143485 isoform X2 [Schistocerca cancellata]
MEHRHCHRLERRLLCLLACFFSSLPAAAALGEYRQSRRCPGRSGPLDLTIPAPASLCVSSFNRVLRLAQLLPQRDLLLLRRHVLQHYLRDAGGHSGGGRPHSPHSVLLLLLLRPQVVVVNNRPLLTSP